MKRILVFDFGSGGEQVASYLEQELSVVEVVRLIDWSNPTCDNFFPAEIPRLAERLIHPYVGRFDLIVLGGYIAALALPFLQREFPDQLFLGVSIDYQKIIKYANRSRQVVTLASPALPESIWFDDYRHQIPGLELKTPNCTGWEQLINDRKVSVDLLKADLMDALNIDLVQSRNSLHRGRPKRTAPSLIEQMSIATSNQESGHTAAQNFLQIHSFAQNSSNIETFAKNLSNISTFAVAKRTKYVPPTNLPDVVVLLNTHFWAIKRELEEIFGWRVKILDFREKLLHDVCLALKLRGVHGGRPR